MSEMRVVGVRVELPANQPILLLRETSGERYLPIWIGSVEATAIALEQQGVKPPRPLTHDLLKDVITALGRARSRCGSPSCGTASSSPSWSSTAGSRCQRPAVRLDRAGAADRRADPRRGAVLAEAGLDHPGRAGGRGGEVPRVPRLGLPGGLRRRPALTRPSPLAATVGRHTCVDATLGVRRARVDRGVRHALTVGSAT